MKILVDLKPALDGYAGIPQEYKPIPNEGDSPAKPPNEVSSLSKTPAVVGYQKVFIRNLPRRVDSQAIRAALQHLGTIAYLRVPFSMKKKKNLGYGFVIFEEEKTADLLLRDSNFSVKF